MSDIYLSLTETPSVVTLSQPVIASSVAATVTVGNTVTVALDANSLSALENVTVTVGAAVSVSNFPSTQTIAGTVTANLFGYDQANDQQAKVQITEDGYLAVALQANNLGNLPISGTVTVAGFSTVSVGGTIGGLVISGRRSGLAENILLDPSTGHLQAIPQVPNGMGGYANVSDALPLPVKGSVTIGANPSGALTTRFGSVTTANTAQITSAVTNTSRKYLLAQNISAGTVTIGIGFSPTTTQGIQLTAGAGLTFDSFCPTGAVFWLGAQAGAAFTILEG
jgi:hypothetical protein